MASILEARLGNGSPRVAKYKGNIDDSLTYLDDLIQNRVAWTCYIAGPMRGHVLNNFPNFDRVEKDFRDAGYNVISPARVDRDLDKGSAAPSYPAYRYAARDVAAIFYFCDFLVVLDGWRDSVGARAEVALAMWLELPIYDERGYRIYPFGFVESAVDLGFKKEKLKVQYESGNVLGSAFVQYDPDVPEGEVVALPPEAFPGLIDQCNCCTRIDGDEIQVELTRLCRSSTRASDASARETILQEAQRLVHGDRGSDYGHPLDDFTRTVGAFNALTGHNLTPEEGTMFMMCVKLSREANRHKRDNLVDAAGYADCTQQIHEERERRSAECRESSSPSSGS